MTQPLGGVGGSANVGLDGGLDASTAPGGPEAPATVAAPASTATAASDGPGRLDVLARFAAPAPTFDPASLEVGAAAGLAAGAPVTGSLDGIPERFPLDDLSRIDGRGRTGQTFLLDGGSIEGLELRARRFVDAGGERGMELLLKLTPRRLETLLARLQEAGAKTAPLRFRRADVGSDGLVHEDGDPVTLDDVDSSYVASGTDDDTRSWVSTLAREDARIELTEPDGPLAARGLLRIRLRGTDAEATRTLQALVAEFGLEDLFAPPSADAKRRMALMRLLWQVDHAAAHKLTDGQALDTIPLTKIETALRKAGVSQPRIDALRLQEVNPGHFTVLDPVGYEQIRAAGANYVYHSIMQPEHVLSVLREGLKSSLRRYEDGQIIDGMSTSADFGTGGAVGVFTRLVTEKTLLSDDATPADGTDYRLVFRPEVLARTDWYGHPEDRYGRLWDLDSGENFGPALVRAIDEQEYGGEDNELVFRDGLAPEDILYVGADTPEARDRLLETLRKAGFEPPDGRPLEAFVRYAPTLERVAPPGYDVSDPEAFAEQALSRARGGDAAPLVWLLSESPQEFAPTRSRLVAKILSTDDRALHDALVLALKRSGHVLGGDKTVQALRRLASANTAWQQDLWDKLSDQVPTALLGLGDPELTRALERSLGEGGLEDRLRYDATPAQLLALVRDLGPRAARNETWSRAIELAVTQLLERDEDVDALARLLRENSALRVPRSRSWFIEQLERLEDGGPRWPLALFLLEAERPEDVAWAEHLLLQSGNARAIELLDAHVRRHGRLGLDPETLRKDLETIPRNSAAEDAIGKSGKLLGALFARADAALLIELSRRWPWELGDRIDGASWLSTLEPLLAPGSDIPAGQRRQLLAVALPALLRSGAGAETRRRWLFGALARQDDLFDTGNVKRATTYALRHLDDDPDDRDAQLKLAWLLARPDLPSDEWAGIIERVLGADLWDANRLLDWAIVQHGGLELEPQDINELLGFALERDTSSGGEALQWLAARLGPALVLHASDHRLEQLTEQMQYAGASAAGLDGKNGAAAIETLLASSEPKARKRLRWVLWAAGADILASHPEPVLRALRELEIPDPETLGWERDQIEDALNLEINRYGWSSVDPQATAPAIRWLLTRPDGSIDPDRARYALEIAENRVRWGMGGEDRLLEAIGFLENDFPEEIARLREELPKN